MFLESALGAHAVKPCEYDLYVYILQRSTIIDLDGLLCSGDNSIKAFVDFSAMVETVGTSAYTGAAQLIINKVRSHFRHLLYRLSLAWVGLSHRGSLYFGYGG